MPAWSREYLLVEICAVVAVTTSYLAAAKDAGSLAAYMAQQTQPYTFETSQLDVWLFTVSKALVLMIAAHAFPAFLLLLLHVGSIVYLTVKAMHFEFLFPAQYACLVTAMLAAVAELYVQLRAGPSIFRTADASAKTAAVAAVAYQSGYMPIHDVESGQRPRPEVQSQTWLPIGGVHVDSDSEYVSAEEDDTDDEAHDKQKVVKPINRLRPLSEFAFNETPEEIEKVSELRQRFPKTPDERLLRCLRGRDGDVAAAAIMVEDNLIFRAERSLDQLDFSVHSPVPLRGYHRGDTNGSDNPGQWQMETLRYYSGSCIHKWTRDGSPLVLFPLGSSDARGVGQNITREGLETTIIAGCELIGNVIFPEIEQRHGKIRPAITLIFDVEGLGLRQFYMPTLKLFQGLLQKVENNYPESLQVVMIINAPSIFQMFWTVIKPFLPVRTLSKIRIYGADYRERLHELVAPECLPWFYGGLCSCRFEGGCLPYGLSKGYTDPHKDDEGYYFSGKVQPDCYYDHPLAITKTDLRRHERQHQQNKMSLAWCFKLVQGATANFQLLFMAEFDVNYQQRPSSSFTVLREQEGIRPGQVMHGEILAEAAGTYILRWRPMSSPADIRFKLKEPPQTHLPAATAGVADAVKSINDE